MSDCSVIEEKGLFRPERCVLPLHKGLMGCCQKKL